MRVIIAGGRDFDDYEAVCRAVEQSGFDMTEVISGGATGADELGEWWAYQHGVPFGRCSADWERWGHAAGPIRNREMADMADALIALPGGRGTADMVRQMRKRGKPVHEHKEQRR